VTQAPGGNGHASLPFRAVEWADVVTGLRADLAAAGRLAVAISPMLTVEEAWMLCEVARSIDSTAFLALGNVPVAGDDETFPGGFTIRGEKCPNRKGVEEVLAAFGAGGRSWHDLVAHVAAGHADAAWITAGYPGPWIDDEQVKVFAGLSCLAIQDLFDSPLTAHATWRLPATGFAERAGTWVNVAHHAQTFRQAIRPPAGVWPEGRLYWNMLGRRGLYDAAAIRRELAGQSAAFAALADDVPATGIDLRVRQLA
jgi:NADH-quinone oxidoreductase subunit G